MTKDTRNQYLAAICVNILSLGGGASISWTSPYLSLLQSEDKSPLGKAISASEASWIGSLLAIGALSGSFFFGWLSEKFGRFRALNFAAVPQIIWWVIVVFSPSVEWLCIGRLLAGFSAGGTFALVPLYIAEISQDHIRGSTGSLFILSTNLGMLLIYIAGSVFDYYTTPKVMLLLPVIFVMLFSYFPETPVYLLRHKKKEEAERSLKFLRGINKTNCLTEAADADLQTMIRKVNNDATRQRGSNLHELRSTAAKKAIFIGVVLISVNQLSGLFAFLSYTADIFIEADSVYAPNTCAIIVGALLVSGSLISLTLVDKFSRRFLYSVTTVGNIIGLLSMGLYSYLKTTSDVSSFKFIPVMSLSLVIFCASSGRLPLTYIMMAEIMPQSIRSFGVSVSTTFNWILAFGLLRYFSTLVALLQFYTCMFIFCGFALFGMFFVMFYVPETKGKSFEEIENSLTSKIFKYSAARANDKNEVEEQL